MTTREVAGLLFSAQILNQEKSYSPLTSSLPQQMVALRLSNMAEDGLPGRGLGHWQQRPFLPVNTALPTLS